MLEGFEQIASTAKCLRKIACTERAGSGVEYDGQGEPISAHRRKSHGGLSDKASKKKSGAPKKLNEILIYGSKRRNYRQV